MEIPGINNDSRARKQSHTAACAKEEKGRSAMRRLGSPKVQGARARAHMHITVEKDVRKAEEVVGPLNQRVAQ